MIAAMKQFLFVIALLLTVSPVRAQADQQGPHPLLTEQPTTQQVRDYETQFGSEFVPSKPNFEIFISPDLCPPAKSHTLAQPLQYKRPATDLPPLSAEYFFAVSDSVVQCVTYDWGETPLDMIARLQRGEEDIEDALELYDTAFTSIVNVLTSQLGKAQRADATPTKKQENDEEYFRREASWAVGDQVVEMFMIVGRTTRRIRATQYWQP